MGVCAIKQIQIKAESSAIHYSSAVSRERLIEQIGTPKANKIKWLSTTAEKREMEELRRQVAQAYKFQMSECTKQLKMQCQAMLDHSTTAEKRDLEEQRRL